ncbi:MAG: OmpH family outer membrane protein [Mangrovibacterium sp.]
MKKNLIINLVFAVAIAALFILHFTSNKSGNTGSDNHASSTELTMAYVNVDSILMHYELSLALHEEFTKNQASYTDEYAKKRSAWETKAARFQEKVQRGGFLTEERAIQERNQLASEQEELIQLDQELSNKLAEMQNKNTNQVIEKVMTTIEKYNKEKKFTYIISANSLLAADGALNVTADILKIMNDEYTPEKK